MPAAVGAVVAVIGTAAAKFSLANFIISTAISMALNAVGSALFGKKPKTSGQRFDQGIQEVVRGSVEPHRVIYGQVRVGGHLSFASTAGSKNKFLYMVITVAGHEVEEIGDIWLDDVLLPPLDSNGWVKEGRFKDHVRIIKHLGAADQLADSMLVSEVAEWTAAHRGRGRAYVAMKLVYDRDIFPTGIPHPKFLVKGKNDIYDPRTDSSGYSNNWALCASDYIRSGYGAGAELSEVHLGNLIEQANISDELVPVSAGVTQKRYTLDGTFTADEEPIVTLERMMTAGAGAPVWTKGRYHIYCGSYIAPEITLTEDDFIGTFRVTPHLPRRELFNRVRGSFIDPENNWQANDLPPVENPLYVDQDGGEVITRDIELPYTTNTLRGQRISKIHLEKGRQGIIVEGQANLRALKLGVMKTVALHIPRLGWINKPFVCLAYKESPIGGIDLVLQEEAAESYDWNFGEATTRDPAPNTDLPRATEITVVTGFSLDSVLVDTEAQDKIFSVLASWNDHEDRFVSHGGFFEIEYKKSDETTFKSAGRIAGNITQTILLALAPDVLYDVRIFAANYLGLRSAPTTLYNFLVGTTVTTNREDWENKTNHRNLYDWEIHDLLPEDWE